MYTSGRFVQTLVSRFLGFSLMHAPLIFMNLSRLAMRGAPRELVRHEVQSSPLSSKMPSNVEKQEDRDTSQIVIGQNDGEEQLPESGNTAASTIPPRLEIYYIFFNNLFRLHVQIGCSYSEKNASS